MSMPQPSVTSLFQQAQACRLAGQIQKAELLCQQILTFAPRHHDSLHLLGEIAGQCGRHDDALALIGDAIKLEPAEPRYYYDAAAFFINMGRFDEAGSRRDLEQFLDGRGAAGAHGDDSAAT